VTSQASGQPDIKSILQVILLCSLIIVLPGVAWSLFGWLHMFLPLLAFFILSKYGRYTGIRLLAVALVPGAILFSVLNSFDLFVFSLVLMLSGYVLFDSAVKGHSPPLSGLKASLALALGWIAIVVFSTYGNEGSAYAQLIQSLGVGIDEALLYYRQSEKVSAETLIMLESTLHRMKVIVPIVMPAVLGSIVLLTIWFTMVVGNNLLGKAEGSHPWPSYALWQLPERLIWLVIFAALAVLVPAYLLRMVGINALILLSIIYSFQGLAITVFYMNKWNVPILLRSFLYVIMVLQSFGTIALVVLGIADIWFDFRKLKTEQASDE
jgi:hypothetical protein